MAENGEKIPAVVYVLGVVVGAISAYAVASLGQSPSPLAAVLGGLCAFGAADPHESVFEEFGWAHVALFFVIFIALLLMDPEEDPFLLAVGWVVGNVLLAAAIGGLAGELVFKLWKALVPLRFRDPLKPQEPLPAMWMAEKEAKIPEVVYFLGGVVGAISTYAVASEWLNLPPAELPAVIGGVAGFFAVAERESIFRALVWALLAAASTAISIALLPESLLWIIVITVPLFVGRFTGALVFNLWKAHGR